VERTRRVREERDAGAWEAAVAAVREAASGDANVLPPLREALRAGGTVGELCGVLRECWGTHDAVRARS
jgi:methylmalonyl-CoA mutase N-terminal domain/subunit